MSLLGLFLRFDYQLPDMLVATLTKDSARRAYINNISARELIGYMEQYAHPCMRAGVGGPGGVSPCCRRMWWTRCGCGRLSVAGWR